MALLLGGSSLKKFVNSLRKTPDLNIFATYLELVLKFDKAFSSWLAANFHRLTDGSIKLLYPLSVDSFMQVKLSTVTTFSTDPEVKAFKRLVASFEDVAPDKLSVLDIAVKLMYAKRKTMTLRDFKEAVSVF